VGVGRFLKAGNTAVLMRSIMILSVHRNIPEELHASTPFVPNRLMSIGSQNKAYFESWDAGTIISILCEAVDSLTTVQ
jgi:hypothetical protein